MELILNMPMLANHRDEDSGRSDEARNIDAIVTRNGSARVGRTNRFDDNHRLEVRPLRELRQRHQVCDGPDPAPYRAAILFGTNFAEGRGPGRYTVDSG